MPNQGFYPWIGNGYGLQLTFFIFLIRLLIDEFCQRFVNGIFADTPQQLAMQSRFSLPYDEFDPHRTETDAAGVKRSFIICALYDR
jgi:hypothetical protein